MGDDEAESIRSVFEITLSIDGVQDCVANYESSGLRLTAIGYGRFENEHGDVVLMNFVDGVVHKGKLKPCSIVATTSADLGALIAARAAAGENFEAANRIYVGGVETLVAVFRPK